jgi:hypothetical protein
MVVRPVSMEVPAVKVVHRQHLVQLEIMDIQDQDAMVVMVTWQD